MATTKHTIRIPLQLVRYASRRRQHDLWKKVNTAAKKPPERPGWGPMVDFSAEELGQLGEIAVSLRSKQKNKKLTAAAYKLSEAINTALGVEPTPRTPRRQPALREPDPNEFGPAPTPPALIAAEFGPSLPAAGGMPDLSAMFAGALPPGEHDEMAEVFRKVSMSVTKLETLETVLSDTPGMQRAVTDIKTTLAGILHPETLNQGDRAA